VNCGGSGMPDAVCSLVLRLFPRYRCPAIRAVVVRIGPVRGEYPALDDVHWVSTEKVSDPANASWTYSSSDRGPGRRERPDRSEMCRRLKHAVEHGYRALVIDGLGLRY